MNYLFLNILFILFLIVPEGLQAQKIEKVEPPHWYVGMHNPAVQLLIYGENIQNLIPEINQEGIEITQTHKVENPNYLFLDLTIANNAQSGFFNIKFKGTETINFKYELKKRRENSAKRETFSSKDVVYLITPDRFANGDPSNDEVAGMKEGLSPDQEYGRHGGDLKGIADNLDYISEMGFTAIWLNPVLENDQAQWSYHGYSTTDYYKVDPRFGNNDQYVKLSKQAREKGIGLIMDLIVNHCGSAHWWANDLPTSDWYNYQHQPYQPSNHRRTTISDPYASKIDREHMVKGWFVPTMPDLNQKNPFLATYLIQNTIWWIEYADLYGVRQDTYSYPYKEFMAAWTCAIENEYPGFNIVGEEWSDNPNTISYWQRGKINQDGYVSCLRSVMDFPLNIVLPAALSDKENWNKGFIKIYEHLANDYIYPSPMDLMIFGDNHDMSRIYEQLNYDFDNFKIAMAFILTTRGIPQIFYGTEILMNHPGTDSHGAIRKNFPGGWTHDNVNGFSQRGLTEQEIEAQDYIKQLLNWRKQTKAVQQGQLTHFAPQDGTYVYFRYHEDSTIMVILNKNDSPHTLDTKRFAQFLKDKGTLTNIMNGLTADYHKSIDLPEKGAYIFEVNVNE